MNTNSETPSKKEIRYLRFLSETLQARAIQKEIGDEFSRKVFDYFENEPLFEPQIFCALIYHYIHKCKNYESVIRRLSNPIDLLRFSHAQNELDRFINANVLIFKIQNFELDSLDKPIEEKLKQYLEENEPLWKKVKARIIPPNLTGNAAYYTRVDIEFSLPHLTTEQKLDILHFTICALNYLSQKDDLIETFMNLGRSSEDLENRRKALMVISNELNEIRKTIINEVVRDKQSLGNELEFDENLPEVSRMLKAKDEDLRIEKLWLDNNSSIFKKPETEAEEINLDENLKITLNTRQWLIAFRFFLNHFNSHLVKDINTTDLARILAVLNNGKNFKNFYDGLRNENSLFTASTRDSAQEVANICRDVGLKKIADEIEKAIEKVKKNYL